MQERQICNKIQLAAHDEYLSVRVNMWRGGPFDPESETHAYK